MSKATYGSAHSDGVSGKIIVIGIVVFAVAIGLYMYSQYSNSSSGDVSGTIAGYEEGEDSDHLRMTVDVTRDDTDEPAHCIVTALDGSKAEVGRREVVVAAGGDESTRLVVDIPTHTKGVAGEVYGCSTVFPSYLDDSEDTPSVTEN